MPDLIITLFSYSVQPGDFAVGNFQFGNTSTSFDVTSIAEAVREPSTWMMMLLGFAGLGFMAYRRKSAPVLTSPDPRPSRLIREQPLAALFF
jgi:hypothetical protein